MVAVCLKVFGGGVVATTIDSEEEGAHGGRVTMAKGLHHLA